MACPGDDNNDDANLDDNKTLCFFMSIIDEPGAVVLTHVKDSLGSCIKGPAHRGWDVGRRVRQRNLTALLQFSASMSMA